MNDFIECIKTILSGLLLLVTVMAGLIVYGLIYTSILVLIFGLPVLILYKLLQLLGVF